MTEDNQSSAALGGIKVVDLSRFLPASFCTMMLADFGADVIRIEQPREVEKQNRIFGRDKFTTEQMRQCKEQEMLSRNKRTVFLNLREDTSRQALRKMLRNADVLIHDYRQENIVAMGFDEASLRAEFPHLIHTTISLCGVDGPYQSLAGHDPIALALSGALSRFGDGGEHRFHVPGLPVGDLSTALQTVIGILMALRVRDKTGLGQAVDIAMSDCALSLMTSVMQRFLIDKKEPPLEWAGANIGLWQTKDGKTLCTTDLEPAYWEKFCKAVNREDLIALQFSRDQADYRDSQLTELFATKTRDEWFAFLREAGTQVAPAYTLDEALEDPHAKARGTLVEMTGSDGHPVKQIGAAIKLSETPGRINSLGHLSGEDTQNVLREFGFSDEEINRLINN